MMTRISRRRFLIGASVGLAGAVPALSALRWLEAFAGPPSLEQTLARLFRHHDSARRIGRAYLRLHPEEADVALLRYHLESALPPTSWATGGTSVARRALVERSRQDFGDDNTVAIEGWILSRTEGRACALLAVVQA
jgi:hypothetical protein